MDRLQTIAQAVPENLPRTDARLGSMAIYLLMNGAPRDTVVRRALLEQISQLTELDSDDRLFDPIHFDVLRSYTTSTIVLG